MSSESRSSSAVRNLRSIFENKATEATAPDSRGRSPSGLGSDKENGAVQPPKSKVHASFVPVEPVSSKMSDAVAAPRRGSFGEADGDLELKQSISGQQAVLGVPETAVESANPSAVGTPLRHVFPHLERTMNAAVVADKLEKEPSKPDKPTTGAEEEAGDLKPADPSDEVAVSGGQALPAVAEDLRSTAQSEVPKAVKKSAPKTPATASKPAAISTKPPSKPIAPSVKSPVSQPKTPVSAKVAAAPDSVQAIRPPRSSLTAPTAASMARTTAAEKIPSTKTSPTAKTKPREVTKPVNISSHLTAPTAASRAKHEADAAPAPTLRTSLVSRPKPQNAPKPTPRSSLAPAQRPLSRDSLPSTRRSLAPVDGSFLDRMTRPTAASANHRTEKVEVKSPPKPKPAAKAKVNGHVPKSAAHPAAPGGLSIDLLGVETEPAVTSDVSTLQDAIAGADNPNTGAETPDQSNGERNVALEATPAGLGGGDAIR